MLVKRNNGQLSALVALHVADSFSLGDDEFMAEEQEEAGAFRSKDRLMLWTKAMVFNRLLIRRNVDGSIDMEQSDKIRKLSIPKDEK